MIEFLTWGLTTLAGTLVGLLAAGLLAGAWALCIILVLVVLNR